MPCKKTLKKECIMSYDDNSTQTTLENNSINFN